MLAQVSVVGVTLREEVAAVHPDGRVGLADDDYGAGRRPTPDNIRNVAFEKPAYEFVPGLHVPERRRYRVRDLRHAESIRGPAGASHTASACPRRQVRPQRQ